MSSAIGEETGPPIAKDVDEEDVEDTFVDKDATGDTVPSSKCHHRARSGSQTSAI